MKIKYLPFYNLHETADGRVLFQPYWGQCYIVPKEQEEMVRNFFVHMNIATNAVLLVLLIISKTIGIALAIAVQIYYCYKCQQFKSFLVPTDEKITRRRHANTNIEAMAEKISFFGLYGMVFLMLPILGFGIFLATVKEDIAANLMGALFIVLTFFSGWNFIRMIGVKRRLKREKAERM